MCDVEELLRRGAAELGIQLTHGQRRKTLCYLGMIQEHNQRLNLVVLRKVGPTPARYPRRTGIPQKRPL
ncbi:hypothetical protein [Candidatus Hakubella thermalkaliphila]|uniref:Uncharacterized protein n=1 Tax=Candidatus Hakubella thermalkaliphila TaxID=2754717 RepID=A0A6V8PD10_9ACTN|nr:hypothetical protein [Candidatus Hakubella thermalkaliphila]GFP30609.1 hypothetical protein HKBW3S34_01529 [Candidatus Hakubella thermalkaliphila]